MVTIEFQNTLDDYREANGVAPRSSGWRRVRRGLGTLAVLAAGALGLLGLFGLLGDGGTPEDAEPFPWGRLAMVLAPSLILFAIFFWFVLHQTSRTPEPWNPAPPHAPPSRGKFVRGVAGWFVSIALAVALFSMLQRPASAPGVPPATQPVARLPAYFEHLLPLTGWVLLVALMLAIGSLQRSRGVPKAWAALGNEQQPRVLRADDAGISIEQSTARLEYRWAHFAGYRETANLVLLYLSPYVFLMIPKRAFADRQQLAAFKGFVMSGIAWGHFLPAGGNAFSVVPLARAAPAAAPAAAGD